MARCVILPKSDGFTVEGVFDPSPEGGVGVCQRERMMGKAMVCSDSRSSVEGGEDGPGRGQRTLPPPLKHLDYYSHFTGKRTETQRT